MLYYRFLVHIVRILEGGIAVVDEVLDNLVVVVVDRQAVVALVVSLSHILNRMRNQVYLLLHNSYIG
jgi:hypothetical protein